MTGQRNRCFPLDAAHIFHLIVIRQSHIRVLGKLLEIFFAQGRYPVCILSIDPAAAQCCYIGILFYDTFVILINTGIEKE